MTSEEDNSVVFEPWSRKAGIAGSSYLVQIGKVNDYWSIAIFRGRDLISVKKVGTLDPNVLTSVISSSISLPLMSPYAIVRSLGNIINEAKVRKFPMTYTPSPTEEQPATPTPEASLEAAPTPTPAAVEEAAPKPQTDFEALTGLKRVEPSKATVQEEATKITKSEEEISEVLGEPKLEETEAPKIESCEDMLSEFATGPSTAFRSMFEEGIPAKPKVREATAPMMEIPALSPSEMWQKGISGLTFFLEIAISFMRKRYGKDLDKLWQYYLEVETKSWKAAKDLKFEEVVKTIVNIERSMGSELEVQEFTDSTFKAKVTKCLSKNYKEKYKSALQLPDEFPCILCKIRGEAVSRNLGYSFKLIESPEGCQLEMSSSPKKEKLII